MKRAAWLATLALTLAALGACRDQNKACCAIPPDNRVENEAARVAMLTEAARAEAGTEFALPATLPEPEACLAGLKERGLKPNELWLVMQTADGMCPNVGVDEARIRQIIGLWKESGCTTRAPETMLHALDSGACGGDAG